MHSLELSLHTADDAWVRADWQRLADAGLPSRITATSPNAAPHITITVSTDPIPTAVHRIATDMFAPLLPCRLGVGGTLLFGDDPVVVSRTVEAPAPLVQTVLDFHRRTALLMTHLRHTWVPHITLARRARSRLVTDMLTALQPAKTRTVTAAGMWCWNPDTRVRHHLIPRRSFSAAPFGH